MFILYFLSLNFCSFVGDGGLRIGFSYCDCDDFGDLFGKRIIL